MAEVGDLVQRIRDGHTSWVLDDRAIERLGDAVCSLHRAHRDEKREFLGFASKPWSKGCEWFSLKTTRTVFSGLASKSVTTGFSV
jgi:hypothetical protein